ncbi:hypothetical protein ACIRNI_13420 [Streptomyces sp. NPDC093546]|uniref:hypothetical protein n=1 Tax=Streptomyces sp. NPDC093546 TaxID=3366040 RepID=UPI00380E960D
MFFESAVAIIGMLAPLIGFVALVVWIVVRITSGNRWARAAVFLALGTGLLFLWGLGSMFVLDVEEACTLSRGQEYAPEETGAQTLLPMSYKCNASYDLVPGYVNPGLAVGAVSTVVCAVLAVRHTWRRVARERSVAGATLDNR